MKFPMKKFALALGLVLLATLAADTASASCGDYAKARARASLRPQSWTGHSDLFRPISDDIDPIVGMWHVLFTAQAPDGTTIPVDNALVVWHSDKTEIMNSARPPQDGDFCLGVWENRGQSSYKLNHFAWLANDTANAPSGIGNPTGPTQLIEKVTLSPDGNHYSGTFTLNAYDTNFNVVAHLEGSISATRITVHTKTTDLM